jgi:hypothetical protein
MAPKTAEATFSLRQLISKSILKTEKSEQIDKFQSFCLNNSKTLDALAQKKIEFNWNCNKEKIFSCVECDEKWAICDENWPQIVSHFASNCPDAKMGKHLSQMLDQHLVLFETKEPEEKNCGTTTNICSVLRCRKCKFYLPQNVVFAHAQKCWPTRLADAAHAGGKACALCGAHSHRAPGEKACAQTLMTSRAVRCNNNNNNKNNKNEQLSKQQQAVNQKNLDKLKLVYANVFNTFYNGENIEELIVASKQRLKIIS